MRKGFICVAAIAILLSLVACSFEAGIVRRIELEDSSFLISTINMDSRRNLIQVKVKAVYPVTSANKKVSFELIDSYIVDAVTGKEVTYEYSDAQETLSGTYKWSDFVEVSSTGVLSFKSFEIVNSSGDVKRTDAPAQILKNVHSSFVIRTRSELRPSVYTDAEFYINYDIPSDVKVDIKRNNKYAVDAKKDIELTTNETLKIALLFNENEYPVVKYAYVDEQDNVVDLELKEKDDADRTKYYAISTVAELYPETMEYKALKTDITGSTLVIKNYEGSELTRFTTYINRINDAEELKAFLADNSVTYKTGSREEQLKNAEEGCLFTDISVTAINSEATVKKTLNTNEYDITFEPEKTTDPEFPIALNLDGSKGIEIIAGNSTIALVNNTVDATLINAGSSSLEIHEGTLLAITHKANSKAVTLNTSGYLKIEEASINTGAFDIEDGGNGEAVGIEAANTSICGELNNVSVTATGKNATAVKVNYSKITKGCFKAEASEKAIAVETNGQVEITEISLDAEAKEAIAVNDITGGLKIRKGQTVSELSAAGTAKAFGFKTVGSAEISSVKIDVSSENEAVGVLIDAGNSDTVTISNVTDSTVAGKVAIGIYNYNANSTTLDEIKLTVTGNKTDNNILKFKNTELPYMVAGIINVTTLKVTGVLDLNIKNSKSLATTTDCYGFYNTEDGYVEFEAENSANFIVKVNVNVENGGSCALKNAGKVLFTNVNGDFTANRKNEAIGASQMTTYALDNTSNTSLGIIAKGGTLKFIAKSHNSTSGEDLKNVIGYVFKEKLGTEEDYGYVTISVMPFDD